MSKYSLKEANYELRKWATNNFELKKFEMKVVVENEYQ